jgi:hypothetical protein
MVLRRKNKKEKPQESIEVVGVNAPINDTAVKFGGGKFGGGAGPTQEKPSGKVQIVQNPDTTTSIFDADTGKLLQNLTQKEEVARNILRIREAGGNIPQSLGSFPDAPITQNIREFEGDLSEKRRQKRILENIQASATLPSIEQQRQQLLSQETQFANKKVGAVASFLGIEPTESGDVETAVKTGIGAITGLLGSAFASIKSITGLFDKDTVDIRGARANFKQLNTAVSNSIDLVETGQASYEDVNSLLKDAIKETRTLEKKAKKKGLDNLNYWLLDGKDLEIEANTNLAELEALQLRLLLAENRRRGLVR